MVEKRKKLVSRFKHLGNINFGHAKKIKLSPCQIAGGMGRIQKKYLLSDKKNTQGTGTAMAGDRAACPGDQDLLELGAVLHGFSRGGNGALLHSGVRDEDP